MRRSTLVLLHSRPKPYSLRSQRRIATNASLRAEEGNTSGVRLNKSPQAVKANKGTKSKVEEEDPSANGEPTFTVRKPKSRERRDTLLRRELRKHGEHDEAKKKHPTPPEGIPIPPFLQPKEQKDRFHKWYAAGAKTPNHLNKQIDQQRKAPFSIAFKQNPYAQALAAPIREDAFTHARLPKFCLIDFHLVAEKEKTKLLPLGLAAENISKSERKKRRGSKEVKLAIEAQENDTKYSPQGTATYVVAKKEALDYIGKNTKKRLHSHAVGIRMFGALEEDQLRNKVEWRPDMGDVVLKNLRKIVRKKLSSWLIGRVKPEDDAVFAALPGQRGLHMLDEIDDVGCVLRLKQPDPNAELMPNRVPQPIKPVRSHFYPNQTSFLGATYGDFDHQTPAEKQSEEDAKRAARGEIEAEVETPPWVSKTQVIMTEHWSRSDARRFPFLGHVLPLPPPSANATWYFPTTRWRKQRIPIFDLQYLLGESEMAKLVGDTIFKDTVLATLKYSSGTTKVLMWLVKLQAFLAQGKTKTSKV